MPKKNINPNSFEVLIQVLLVLTGKVLVFLISLGAWRSESMSGTRSIQYTLTGPLSFIHQGGRFITVAGQELIGIVFYAMLFGVLVVLMLDA